MTTTECVENILRASHAARNSDFELWLVYAAKSGLELSERQISVLRDMPSFETIRRTRQKLQEQGLYPADPSVDKRRFEKFKQVRQTISEPVVSWRDIFDH
jgi:hypothetical protein